MLKIRIRLIENSVFLISTTLFALVVVLLLDCPAVRSQDDLGNSLEPTVEQLEFFEKEIRPLLVEHCFECHSRKSGRLKAELLLDSRQGMLKGGDSGPAIIATNADESLLIQAVRYEEFEMPPKGKLPAKEIDALAKWVAMGAPWSTEIASTDGPTREVFKLQDRKEKHWAWQPIQNPSRPPVVDQNWPRSAIDYFILSGLEGAGMRPANQADKSSLVRRLYFDLIGLPPSPDQVQEYLANKSEDATNQLVDQLLESPHFGERWGRHWLDLVRYAESRGHEFDNDAPYAYQYRDYVIRAFNADLTYDQLVREHIAGDLLKSPRLNPAENFNESILGTGFWHLGEWVHSPVDIRKDESDRFDNMIDVMSKAFLGVTLSCARCHDHKFDAISTDDYYAISGFLQSSDYREVAFDSLEHNRNIGAQLSDLNDKFSEQVRPLLSKVAPTAFEEMNQLYRSKTIAAEDPSLADCWIVDYAKADISEFLSDGQLFGNRPRRLGEFFLSATNGTSKLEFSRFCAAVTDNFWNAFSKQEVNSPNQKSSIAGLPRSGRTLRSPTFTLLKGSVQCRVQGQGHIVACVDSHRLIAGPLHGETVLAIPKADGYQWVTLNLSRYLGHRLHLEFTPAVESTLEVQLVVQGASPAQLKSLEDSEAHLSNQVARYAQQIESAIQADVSISSTLSKLVETWTKERRDLQQQVRMTSRLAMAMVDGTSEDEHVLIRGNSSNPGNVVPRRFLSAVDGPAPMPIETGSGRLQLAERINAPDNPLTSRVIVNRVWHHLMGRGIVPTTDDFGVLGQRPSHPDLLDHLATKFLSDGRSIKNIIRYVVLSKTYQMDSRVNPAAMEIDPKNQYWHHHPQKRLEGETIRDALLSIAGRLDPTMNGPSIPVHLTSFMDGRGRPGKSGPQDGLNRRSIYLEVRRNFLSPMFVAFDTPTPFSSMGRRNVSNVPAQALILMNDPLVTELASAWAKRACNTIPIAESQSPDARVNWMYLTAFAREASPPELKAALTFLERHASQNALTVRDEALWEDFAHALVNKKEFIFQR